MKFSIAFLSILFALTLKAGAFEPNWVHDWSSLETDSVPKQPRIVTHQFNGTTIADIENNGVRRVSQDLSRIRDADAADQKAAAEWIQANQLELPPPYLWALSRHLIETDRELAAEYLFVAQIRTAYDVWRCKDRSGAQTLQYIASQRPDVFSGLQENTEEIVSRAINAATGRSDLFAHQSSPWWVCSASQQTLQAASQGQPLNVDEWRVNSEEWPTMQDTIRSGFRNGANGLGQN